MDSKSEKSNSDGNRNNQRKKSTRKKKPVDNTVPNKTSRRTRQKGATSDQQYALPQNIPISNNPQLITYQSYDRENTKIIIQLPLTLFKQNKTQHITWTRVEESIIDLKLKVEDDTISIQAKIHSEQAVIHDSESEQEDMVYSIWGKTFWVGMYEVSSKISKQAYKTISVNFSEIQRIKTKQVNSDIFIILNFKKKTVTVSDYNGLINQGNTCYMNSYLQMLFHISQFQNLVFEAHSDEQTKFPATLQILFYNLAHQHKAVSPEQLVKSFGWSKKQALIQQDAQEFSCLFFEVLERKLDEFCYDTKRYNMRQMFSGKLLHIIACTDVSKEQPFFDLQLTLTDSLEHSLDDYVSEQMLIEDNMFETEKYGKQPAKKSVRILSLPPILMIQLKRFEFSPVTYKNQKIMTKFRYPNQIDFSKWLVHPQSKTEYQLYAVLVHEGIKAESGHYYVYIKDQNSWYKFNDQEVTKASERQVFQYNFGGQNMVIDLDSREMKVINQNVISSSTAYMLVYARKQMANQLLNSKIQYPPWLKAREISKQQQKQELKARKNFYHKIKTVIWQNQILNNSADYIGLFEKSIDEGIIADSESYLEKLAKNQRIDEWLKQYNQKNIGVYVYLTNFDKTEYETLVNLQHRKSSFQELLRDQISPVFVFIPKIVSLNSYLYVIKLLTLKNQKFAVKNSQEINGQKIKIDQQIQIKFNQILEIGRSAKNFELLSKLQQIYNEEEYSYRFYFEQKKQLKQIYKDNNIVLGPPTPRNVLSVLIVQKLPKQIVDHKPDFKPTEKWYKNQKNTVQILVKSETGKYQFMVYVDQNISIDDFRELIFEQRLKDDENYASPAYIVLKSKLKKNAKAFVEQTGVNKVKDLLKGCDREKIVMFEPSSLNAEERINQAQIKFYYRFQDFSFSDSLRIVIEKESKNQLINLYDKISKNQEIKNYQQLENFDGLKLLLFSKDRLTINDLVMLNGTVPGKGQLINVLQKQKNTNLVVVGFPTKETSEEKCPILISHKSQNGQKIGKPRYIEVDRKSTFLELRETIIDLIQDQTYQWQQKQYALNPFKLYIYTYWKDIRKNIQLYDEQELQQIENNYKQNGENKEECESSDKNGKVNEQKSGQNAEEMDANSEDKQKLSGDMNKDEASDSEVVEIKKKKDNRKKSENYREFTIQNKFPKVKFLKVCIVHLYLVKNTQMKLNV